MDLDGLASYSTIVQPDPSYRPPPNLVTRVRDTPAYRESLRHLQHIDIIRGLRCLQLGSATPFYYAATRVCKGFHLNWLQSPTLKIDRADCIRKTLERTEAQWYDAENDTTHVVACKACYRIVRDLPLHTVVDKQRSSIDYDREHGELFDKTAMAKWRSLPNFERTRLLDRADHKQYAWTYHARARCIVCDCRFKVSPYGTVQDTFFLAVQRRPIKNSDVRGYLNRAVQTSYLVRMLACGPPSLRLKHMIIMLATSALASSNDTRKAASSVQPANKQSPAQRCPAWDKLIREQMATANSVWWEHAACRTFDPPSKNLPYFRGTCPPSIERHFIKTAFKLEQQATYMNRTTVCQQRKNCKNIVRQSMPSFKNTLSQARGTARNRRYT